MTLVQGPGYPLFREGKDFRRDTKMNALSRIRDKTYKTSFSDPVAERILRAFFGVAGSELDCRVIAGRSFPTVADHTEFIGAGGL